VKRKLPSTLICPSCLSSRPISEMSIDKRFTTVGEPHAPEPSPNPSWRIRCGECDPRRGGYYWFSLDQCDTPAKALDCIMKLNEAHVSPDAVKSFIDLVQSLFGCGALIDE